MSAADSVRTQTPEPGGTSFIVEHRIPAEFRRQFLALEESLEKAVLASPGCRSVVMEQEASQEDGVLHYRTTMVFDSQDALLAWVDSEKRQELIHQARQDFHYGYELKAAVRSFDGWFPPPKEQPDAPPPPPWKQNLMVLLTLYPTVLALGLVLAPLTRRLDFPTGMLIANACSVAITGWLLLPVANRIYRSWLIAPISSRTRILGPLSVLVVLLAVLWLARALGLS